MGDHCVEYERLVGKIMRDNFWDLDPFTIGLNPGLLNFQSAYIRSKAPYIKRKMRLLERILARMVGDEHLLLVEENPRMYRPHPNRSTIDYLVIGDDPPWIPHFFNGSQSYPHVEDAMNRIDDFLDLGGASKPPTRVPTVGLSRASTFSISRMKNDEVPSSEEYVDFVHAVVRSGSAPSSTGTIREDQFFPSMAVTPVPEVRKRANLVMRLMARMVEDNVLVRVSMEEGTYVLHPECRPSDYMADRGLTDISHWVWTFKSWAVLDKVAEKAVANLEKFLNDLTPAERARLKVEPDDLLPLSKFEPKPEVSAGERRDSDDDFYILKKEEASSKFPRQTRTPKKKLPKAKSNAVARYVESTPDHEHPNILSSVFLRLQQLHRDFPYDSFEAFITKVGGTTVFKITCYDCDSRKAAIGAKDSILKPLEAHLTEAFHISNVMSKLERNGPMVETVASKERMEALKRLAKLRGYGQNKFPGLSMFLAALVKPLSEGHDSTIHPQPASPSGGASPHFQPPAAASADGTLRSSGKPQARHPFPQQLGMAPDLPRTHLAMGEEFFTRTFDPSHSPGPPLRQTATSTSRSSKSLKDTLDDLRFETTHGIEALENGDEAKSLRLDYHETLFDQATKKTGELKHQIARLIKLDGEQTSRVNALEDKLDSGAKVIVNVARSTIGFEQELLAIKKENEDAKYRLAVLEGVSDPGIDLKALERNVEQMMSRLVVLEEHLVVHFGALKKNNEFSDSRIAALEEAGVDLAALKNNAEDVQSRIAALEDSRGTHLAIIDGMRQSYRSLNDRVGLLEQRDSTFVSRGRENDVVENRISGLESAQSEARSAHGRLKQYHGFLKDRFDKLEQQGQLAELSELPKHIAAIGTRIDDLETTKSQGLTAYETLEQTQNQLSDRLEVIEKQSLLENSHLETPQGSAISQGESIESLTQRCAAQQEHIESLTKRTNKNREWVKYLRDVTDTQKVLITNLQTKAARQQRNEEAFKSSIESRIDELVKGNKQREDKMMERIKVLEGKEERLTGQVAALKGNAASSARSDVGGGSTPPARKMHRKF